LLKRYHLWLAWMLAVGLSVSGSVYITAKPQINILKPLSNNASAIGDGMAQAAMAVTQPASVIPTMANAPLGKLADGVPVLMYHSINVEDNILCVSPGDLEKQLDYLVSEGYHTVTVKHLLAAAEERAALPTKPIVITFDDGYRNNYTVAYPMLKARGMVATIYVFTEKVGTPNGMTAAELREMASYGIEIGSHTRHHLDLRTMNDQGLTDEIVNSRKILAEMLQGPVETFCYPAGKYSLPATQKVQSAAYQGAVTTQPGVMTDLSERWLIPRIRVNGNKDLEHFKAQLPHNI